MTLKVKVINEVKVIKMKNAGNCLKRVENWKFHFQNFNINCAFFFGPGDFVVAEHWCRGVMYVHASRYRVSGPIGPPRLFHSRKNYSSNFYLLFRYCTLEYADCVYWVFFNMMIPSVFFNPLKIWSVSPIFWYQIILMSSYTSPEHPLEQLWIDFLLPTHVL